MYPFTLITYQESRCGFLSDDWQIINTISSKEDLLAALKESYLTDARNRSCYPLHGFEFKFIFTYENFDLEGYYWLGGDFDLEDSSFYQPGLIDLRNYISYENEILKKECEDVFTKFNKWKNKMKSLIPIIRNKAAILKKEREELDLLFKLAIKYKYKLTKDLL